MKQALQKTHWTTEGGMDVLVTTVQELSFARDMDSVTKIVRTAARTLTGADGASFIMRDGDLCFYIDEDAIAPLWKGHRFPMAACVSGWAMLNKKAAVIEDIYADERVPVEAYKVTFVKSMAMVPIRSAEPVGALGIYWAEKHLPSAREVKLLQALADITAVTLENVKVYTSLEQRVEESTAHLQNVIRELEAFSYSVSHDMRSPLRTINNYLHMLMHDHSEGLSDEGRSLANKALGKSKDMWQLIDDMLAFFKISRVEPSITAVSMQDLAQKAYNEFDEHGHAKNVKFILHELPIVTGDVSMIYQVWMNLIGNAIKYSRNTEGPVVEVGYDTDKGHYYVKDNGAGFDMKYYHKIFEAFERLHTQREFEGTGIGLAIAHRVVTKHGGKLWGEGKVKEGATFYFSIPQH